MLFIIVMVAGYALSWLVVCGFIKLITLCFGLVFSWPIATGIWLVLCLLKLLFPSK